MKTKITSLLCAIVGIAAAQIQKSSGNQLNQRITSVDYLHRGNINNVAVGNTDALARLEYLTNGKAFVSAFDQNGNYVWNDLLTTPNHVTVTAVKVTQNKDIVVVGYIDESITILGTPFDIVVMRFKSDGSLLWSKIYQTPKVEQANDLVEDKEGNLHIVGYCTGFAVAGKDVALLSVSGSGAFIYYTSFGTKSDEWGTDIEIASNGNFVISGTVIEPGIVLDMDQLFLEVKPNYSIVRSVKLGRDKNDEADEIDVQLDGQIKLAGYVTGYGLGLKDISVTTFDPSSLITGTILTQLYSGPYDERALSFEGNIHDPNARNAINNNVLVGFSESFSGVGLKDAIALEIDSAGNLTDSHVHKTKYTEGLYDVTNDTLGRYFYGGLVEETPLGFVDNKFYGYNGYGASTTDRLCRLKLIEAKINVDTLLMIQSKTTPKVDDYIVDIEQKPYEVKDLKLDCDIVTGLDHFDDLESRSISNPIKEYVSASTLPKDMISVEVFNGQGRLIYEATEAKDIYCGHWVTGVYVFKIQTQLGLTSTKIVKE